MTMTPTEILTNATPREHLKVTSILPYFGGKRTMAPEIVKELGPHVQYFEPFCGSLAVLFAKPKSRQEVACDLHCDVINLARVMQHNWLGPKFYRACRRIVLHDSALAHMREELAFSDIHDRDESPNLTKAVQFFAASWCGRNGYAGLRNTESSSRVPVRHTAGGGDPATRVRSAVDSIPAMRRRLREVTFLNRDAFEVIGKIPDTEGVAIYCDPPYVTKSDQYLHDFTDVQHDQLAEALGRFTRARVVVSYYDCDRVRSLYDGWRFESHTRNKNLSVSGRASVVAQVAPEILIVNGARL